MCKIQTSTWEVGKPSCNKNITSPRVSNANYLEKDKERSLVQENKELTMVTLSKSGPFTESDLCFVLGLNLYILGLWGHIP